jgi:hypothetical protein
MTSRKKQPPSPLDQYLEQLREKRQRRIRNNQKYGNLRRERLQEARELYESYQ